MELFMEQFVGLDVSQKLTHVCVVDQTGSVVWRGTCLSTPEDIAATMYHALGVPLESHLHDRAGRPQTLCSGRPLVELFA